MAGFPHIQWSRTWVVPHLPGGPASSSSFQIGPVHGNRSQGAFDLEGWGFGACARRLRLGSGQAGSGHVRPRWRGAKRGHQVKLGKKRWSKIRENQVLGRPLVWWPPAHARRARPKPRQGPVGPFAPSSAPGASSVTSAKNERRRVADKGRVLRKRAGQVSGVHFQITVWVQEVLFLDGSGTVWVFMVQSRLVEDHILSVPGFVRVPPSVAPGTSEAEA